MNNNDGHDIRKIGWKIREFRESVWLIVFAEMSFAAVEIRMVWDTPFFQTPTPTPATALLIRQLGAVLL